MMTENRFSGSGQSGAMGSAQGRPGGGSQGHHRDLDGSTGSGTDRGRSTAGELADRASELGRSTYDKGQRYAREASDRYPQVRQYYEEGTRAVSDRVSEAPLLSLLAIGAAAYGLAWMLHGGGRSSRQSSSYRRARGDYPGLRSGKPLIESDRVEGTAVYNFSGKHIGTIKRVMLDKISGRAAYAVMSFGGFLGIGSDEYAIPWNKLDYDTKMEGYRADITEEQLKKAPSFSRQGSYDRLNQQDEQDLHDYYRVSYYWIGL